MKLFITGTDTHVGKTYVSVRLLQAFNALGFSTLGIKPIATGSIHALHNEDALLLQQASSVKLPYHQINPFIFSSPIAPHIAAAQENISLSVDALTERLQVALSYPADISLIEGAGGWLTPLNESETFADFVCAHQLNTLLVVGMRLGCLNHALLTVKAMQNINAIGWVANCIHPNMAYLDDNIAYLEKKLPIPYLGKIIYEGFLTIVVSPEEKARTV